MNWNTQLRNMMALAILLVLSSALLVLPASAASIPVNGPVVITEPGTYVLTQDITSSSQIVCIEIKASDVVFDGQGHLISGVNNEGSAGIFVSKDASNPVTGVTIKNVRLSNWFYGVYLLNAQNGEIQGVTTTGNANAGIVLYSGSSGNTISGSTLNGNGRGIILSTSSGSNTVSDSTFTGNTNQGVYIFDSNGNTVKGNSISNNTNAGLFIYSASGNVVYNNNFSNLYNALFGGTIGTNSWSTTQTAGTNIVGGPSIGGNFWGTPDGSGFSQTSADSNGDGFCDQPLVITTGNTDNLPLHTPSVIVTPTVTPTVTTTVTPGTESPYKPHNLPVRVEAEDYDNGGEGVAYHDSTPLNLGNAYRLSEGVDVEAGGSGFDVGYITDGEYLKYTVNVTTAGTYTATFNVGAWESGRTITLSDDDGDVAGTVNVPNTGSSSAFAPVAVTLNLGAGTHVLKLTFNGNHQNIDYIDFGTPVTPTPTTTVTVTPTVTTTVTTTVTPGNETPYKPHNLPARVEAEDYDNGGEGVAYHDSTPLNLGNAYRLTEGVDVEAGASGYNVGYITDGEYLKYTVSVATAGTYTATFNVGAWEAGRTITVSDADGDVAGTVNVPNTGNDHTYQSVPLTLNLGAGTHVLKLTFNGNHQNIDYIDFGTSVTPTTTTIAPTTTVTVTPTVTTTVTPGSETPYKAHNLPARVEAEDYDNGGEGVAYHDSTPLNLGNAYRLTEGVDIETGASGYNVGYITDGEYLKYTVSVATAGTYTATFRVGSWEAGRTITVSDNDGDFVGTINVPNTGDDKTYASVPLTVNLGAGTHVLKLTFNGNHQNIDYIDFGTSATPTNTVVPITTVTVTPSQTQNVGAYKPHTLPTRIEAEDYDNGGAGAAYYDSTAGNLGKAYRNDDVDIEAGATGYDVGYITDGEWLTYTVTVPTAGSYTAFFNVASWIDGRTITVSADNTPAGTVQVPNTGDSTVFVNVPMNLNLPAGTHVLKLTFNGNKQNIDYIDFPSGPHAEMALTPVPTVVNATVSE